MLKIIAKVGNYMDNTRRIYLDNIRWITVVIVVIYHIIYMFNGVQPFGVIGLLRSISCRMLFNMWFIPGLWRCYLLCPG